MSKNTIIDYFDCEVEYPSDIALNPLPMNTLWSYVPSCFLNGFVNHVEPLIVYVLDRYQDNKTNEILTLKESYHTKLRQFDDDIILLGKIEHSRDSLNRFMFFWFDMDSSDCCIGRFETVDSNEVVLDSLKNWLKGEVIKNEGRVFIEDCDNGILGFHELPKSFINGWLSF